MTTTALDDDDREPQLDFADPMALLFAKLHQVADRDAGRRTPTTAGRP